MGRMIRFFVMIGITLGFIGSMKMTPNASAESIEGKSAIGANLMYVMPSGGASVGDLDLATDMDSAAGLGLTYTHGITKDWALEVSLDRSSHDIKDSGIAFASADLTTLAVTGQWRPETSSLELSPYTGLGIGYSFVDYSLSSDAKDVLCFDPSSSCKLDGGNNALALLINAGADYFLNDNLALGVEARYIISKSSPELQFNDDLYEYTLPFDLTLDRIDVRAGVKYFF